MMAAMALLILAEILRFLIVIKSLLIKHLPHLARIKATHKKVDIDFLWKKKSTNKALWLASALWAELVVMKYA